LLAVRARAFLQNSFTGNCIHLYLFNLVLRRQLSPASVAAYAVRGFAAWTNTSAKASNIGAVIANQVATAWSDLEIAERGIRIYPPKYAKDAPANRNV